MDPTRKLELILLYMLPEGMGGVAALEANMLGAIENTDPEEVPRIKRNIQTYFHRLQDWYSEIDLNALQENGTVDCDFAPFFITSEALKDVDPVLKNFLQALEREGKVREGSDEDKQLSQKIQELKKGMFYRKSNLHRKANRIAEDVPKEWIDQRVQHYFDNGGYSLSTLLPVPQRKKDLRYVRNYLHSQHRVPFYLKWVPEEKKGFIQA
tara:strand:+ start:61 stop:690 length:630 start_codon:yes stop_codon:yes gene_type:complete